MQYALLRQPAKSIRGLFRYFRMFGVRAPLNALHCLFSKKEKIVPVAAGWSKNPLYLRLNTSDVTVFRQVFLEEEYSVVDRADESFVTIVDGGANIGLTSVYLAQRYPTARIVAVEPEEKNLEVLRLNTKEFPQIQVFEGALWHRSEKLSLRDESAESWGFRVQESSLGRDRSGVEGITIDQLAKRFDFDRISLLKLDVEGAEYELFSEYKPWIHLVDHIVAEIHEKMKPGCEKLFEVATSEFREIARTRELVLASRSRGTSNLVAPTAG